MSEALRRPPGAPDRPGAGVARGVLLLALVYVFLVGVKGLGQGFMLLGQVAVEAIFTATTNPFVGLIVGILVTSLIQSSSVTTAMIVALVAAPENPLPVANAVPMIMGANIGTTVTNTVVSLGHMGQRQEFVRAFAVATCHDFFNFFTVVLLLPLELATGVLSRTATALASRFRSVGGVTYESPVDAAVAAGVAPLEALSRSLFADGVGVAIALVALSGALIYLMLTLIVKTMRAVMESRVESYVTRSLGSSVLVAALVGMVVTVMVQSSSITTSLLVPLAGAGILTVERAFPFTVGANIGTTVTALLASMAASGPNAQQGLNIALVHTLFNAAGAAIFLPWPALRSLPTRAASALARSAVRSRGWALAYVVFVFYLLPAALAALSGLFR